MADKLHPLLVSLRNAYEVHDRPAFEDLLLRVNAKLVPAVDEARASGGFMFQRMGVVHEAATRLSPCARGDACVCGTFEQRMTCTYRAAPRSL